MVFELLLCPGHYYQVGYLRREETSQPAQAFDFAYLVGDALLELFV